MSRISKKVFSLLLCLMMAFSSVLGVTASAFSYPSGVTQEQAEDALNGTDTLVANAVPQFTGMSLEELLVSGLYTDETVSGILVGIYTAMAEEGMDLSALGVDTSVGSVAISLSEKYPQVSEALSSYSEWSEVDVTALSWGVRDKESFATAVGACFAPFNSFLYTLLCSGKMEINSLIKIQGANGYENAIVPILTALGCSDMISQARFTYYADKDKDSMVKNILLPVLTMLEESLDAPMDSFTEILPTFAKFTVSGKLNEYIGILLKPITDNSIVNAMISLGLFSVDMDAEQMINDALGNMSADGGLKLAPIDFDALADCGVSDGSDFIPDKNKAYIEIMRWMVESLKLSGDSIGSLLGDSSGEVSFGTSLTEEETDNIVAMIVSLFSPEEIGNAQSMVYPEMTSFSVEYMVNLTEADVNRALNEIDPLIDEFVKEGGSAETINQVLTSAIYNNDNITALVKGVYGALEENGITTILTLMGIDTTPKGVASYLTSSSHNSAADKLSSVDSWSEIQEGSISWGVSTGSRSGFQSALTAVLRPLAPALRMMLAGEDMVIFDSIVIKGADGYNTAVIPLLEALGCNEDDIKNYRTYKNNASGDGVITQIIDPVLNLLDDICATPVKTLTGILPNIIYFLDSGSLGICVSNLMLPLSSLTKNLSSASAMLDMTALTDGLDIDSLVSGMLSETGIAMGELDVKSFAGMGKAVQRTSKTVIDGNNQMYTYIEADSAGIFLTLLRFVAEVMQTPGNEDLMMSLMSSDSSGAFASYSDTFTSEISGKTTDELVEWLFDLFFKERITATVTEKEDYVPHVIYQEPETSNTGLIVLFVVFGVAVTVAAVIVFSRFNKQKKQKRKQR